VTKHFRALAAMAAALLAMAVAARAEPSADPRVADIVRAGKLRVGLHLPQFVKDPATGEIHGHGTGTVIVQIAKAFADHVGVKLELVGHPSPPVLVECLKAAACDIGFLGYVPGRTADVGFAPPHIMVPFTFMVPANSTIKVVGDADKAGIKIAAVRSHASTIALGKFIKQAETVGVEIPDEAFELLKAGRADAWASPRPPLLEYAPKLAGARVLDDRYGENLQAIAVPKDRSTRLGYVTEWVEAAKTSGLIQRAIEKAGERGIEVAPVEILTGSTPTR